MRAKYKRVLLKISGEALAGTNGFGLDELTIAQNLISEVRLKDILKRAE